MVDLRDRSWVADLSKHSGWLISVFVLEWLISVFVPGWLIPVAIVGWLFPVTVVG